MSPWLSDLFLSSQPDERLVTLACAGHDRAFAVIVERYRGELHAHASRLSSDGRAEDIVQQTFLSAFAALRSGTEVRHLRGWLYQIVRNAATRIHGPRDASLDDVSIAADPIEDVIQQRALAISALSEVGRLPDRQRQALVGTVQGRRRAEIASSMGLSEGAVRQLVHRGRMSVRAAVTAVTPYPLLRWLSARSGASAEVAITAGAASAGGATLKLGALLASAAIAGGIVVGVDPKSHPHTSSNGVAATPAQAGGTRGARATVGAFAARAPAGAVSGGFLGTLPAVLGRGGAAGTRGHEVGTGGGPADGHGVSRGESHSGDVGDAAGGGGPGPSGASQGTGSESSSGSGPGSSGSGEGSTGSGETSGGSGKTSTTSGDGGGGGRDGGSGSGSGSSGSGSGSTGSSGDGGSGGSGTSGSSGGSHGGSGSGSGGGGGSGSSTSQPSGSGTSGPSGSVTTSSESGPGGGAGTTSGDPAPVTTSSSSGSGGGKGPDGGSDGSGSDSTSGRG